jgi:hypothetical protein
MKKILFLILIILINILLILGCYNSLVLYNNSYILNLEINNDQNIGASHNTYQIKIENVENIISFTSTIIRKANDIKMLNIDINKEIYVCIGDMLSVNTLITEDLLSPFWGRLIDIIESEDSRCLYIDPISNYCITIKTKNIPMLSDIINSNYLNIFVKYKNSYSNIELNVYNYLISSNDYVCEFKFIDAFESLFAGLDVIVNISRDMIFNAYTISERAVLEFVDDMAVFERIIINDKQECLKEKVYIKYIEIINHKIILRPNNWLNVNFIEQGVFS